jgi:hypothetical protein
MTRRKLLKKLQGWWPDSTDRGYLNDEIQVTILERTEGSGPWVILQYDDQDGGGAFLLDPHPVVITAEALANGGFAGDGTPAEELLKQVYGVDAYVKTEEEEEEDDNPIVTKEPFPLGRFLRLVTNEDDDEAGDDAS